MSNARKDKQDYSEVLSIPRSSSNKHAEICQPPSWAQKPSCTALSCPSTSGAGHRSRCLKGNRSSLCSLGAQETSGMGRGVDLL